MPTRPKFPLPQAIVFALILLPSFAYAAIDRNIEFLFYAVVTTILAGVIWWMHRRVGFTNGLLWLLTVWAALHMAGGLIRIPAAWGEGEFPVIYNLWLVPPGTIGGFYLRYDHLVHAFGFGVTAWAVWQGLRSIMPSLCPALGPLFIAWIGAQGCGALNEIVEFAAVVAVEETNVGDFTNAMLDLCANATGALVAVVAIYFSGRSRP